MHQPNIFIVTKQIHQTVCLLGVRKFVVAQLTVSQLTVAHLTITHLTCRPVDHRLVDPDQKMSLLQSSQLDYTKIFTM